MEWSWQHVDWPSFSYEPSAIEPIERQFLLRAGEVTGAVKHLGLDEQETLKVQLLSEEAVRTSEIEGELLDRASVQSSLRREFGLDSPPGRIPPRERGIAEVMASVFRTFAEPMRHEALFDWHRKVMSGGAAIEVVGAYRRDSAPMRVISGSMGHAKIHFEAPPSDRVPREMDGFIEWFNATAPTGESPLPPVARAGIAHLYFECIHPFEDGDGRLRTAADYFSYRSVCSLTASLDHRPWSPANRPTVRSITR